MEPVPLPSEVSRQIEEFLDEGCRGAKSPVASLASLASTHGTRVYGEMVYRLMHLDLEGEAARNLLERIERHRQTLEKGLDRDPGFMIAAADYGTNIEPLLKNPAVVEIEFLRRVERSAVTDALTGLYNRRYFDRAIRVELRRSERYRRQTSLVMLDLDRFKEFNDRRGHRFGDRVLAMVGQVLQRAVREADIACRFGGEEFAVVLPETDRLGALTVAERIRESIFRCFDQREVDGHQLRVTISGGIAASPADGTDVGTLLEHADQALYRAKSQGRNRISIFYDEKRRSTRYPVRPRTHARISADPTGSRRVEPVNISLDGALFVTELELAPSQAVEFILGQREPLVMPATVVRIERPVTEQIRRVAVRFLRRMAPEVLSHHIDRHARPLRANERT